MLSEGVLERGPPFPISLRRSRPYRRRPEAASLGYNTQQALTTPSTELLEGGFIFAFLTVILTGSGLGYEVDRGEEGVGGEGKLREEDKLFRDLPDQKLLKDVMTCSLGKMLDVIIHCSVHSKASSLRQGSSGEQRLDADWLSIIVYGAEFD